MTSHFQRILYFELPHNELDFNFKMNGCELLWGLLQVISGFDFFVRRLMIHVSLQVFLQDFFSLQLWTTSFERRFQARYFSGFVRYFCINWTSNVHDFATSFDDWSRTCKRFDFNVELPQDQNMRTSWIHTSIFELLMNSFVGEVTSCGHYITSRERAKYHAHFPCMCHTYFTYILLTYFGSR